MRRPRRPNLSVPRHTKFVSTKFDTYDSSSRIVTADPGDTGNPGFTLDRPRISYPPPPGRPGWLGATALKNPKLGLVKLRFPSWQVRKSVAPLNRSQPMPS